MKIKLGRLLRSGAAFCFLTTLLGVGVALFSATELGFGSKAEIGAGFFPFLVGIVLGVAGLISGISSVRSGDQRSDRETQLPPRSVRRVAYMVIAFIAWLLLTPFLGYIPTTFVVSIAMAKTAGLENWGRPFLLSLGITVSLYLLFDILFYVDLPRGILG